MLDKLQSQYEALLPQLKEMGISDIALSQISFTSYMVDGLNIERNYPYFEIFHYDKNGKNLIFKSTDLEETMFNLIEDITYGYCSRWELENRILNQDTRILTFRKHIELLEKLNLNQKSINELKKEYNQLLDQELFSIK